MAKEVRCRIGIEENSDCKRCCSYCRDICEKKCIFTKRNMKCEKNEVHRITKLRSKELAKEGLKIRKELITKAKSPCIGIYFKNNKFEICKEEELEEKSNKVMLIDVRYEDTLKDMTMRIWKVVNSIFD